MIKNKDILSLADELDGFELTSKNSTLVSFEVELSKDIIEIEHSLMKKLRKRAQEKHMSLNLFLVEQLAVN